MAGYREKILSLPSISLTDKCASLGWFLSATKSNDRLKAELSGAGGVSKNPCSQQSLQKCVVC